MPGFIVDRSFAYTFCVAQHILSAFCAVVGYTVRTHPREPIIEQHPASDCTSGRKYSLER